MLDLLSKETILKEYPLKKIIRYNHRFRLQNETVAEHTCFVSLFCLKIMSKLNLSHEQEREILILASLHDTCEVKTSDIPHDVKIAYKELTEFLDKIENDYYKECWPDYFEIVNNPSELSYNILKLADSYSVYQWCLCEKELGNNSDSLTEIYIDCKKRIEMYTKKINDIVG